MALTRWDPFRGLGSIQEQMNQLFQDTLNRLSCHGQGDELAQEPWMPPVDIYETEEAIILTAELPGVDQKHMAIEVQENMLTLRGERHHKYEVKEKNYFHIERAYGSFQRSFTLPSPVDQSRMTTQYEDGVLEITLPKIRVAQSTQRIDNIG